MALLVIVAYFARSLWLPAGGIRVDLHSDAPAKAEIAVVLAGDAMGHRIEKAAQLVKAGYVPQALISGPPGMYGVNESDLRRASSSSVSEGTPRSGLFLFPDHAHFS